MTTTTLRRMRDLYDKTREARKNLASHLQEEERLTTALALLEQSTQLLSEEIPVAVKALSEERGKEVEEEYSDLLSKFASSLHRLTDALADETETLIEAYELLCDWHTFLSDSSKHCNRIKQQVESILGQHFNEVWDDLPCNKTGPYFDYNGYRYRPDMLITVRVPPKKDWEARQAFFDVLARDPKLRSLIGKELSQARLDNRVKEVLSSDPESKDYEPPTVLPEELWEKLHIAPSVKRVKQRGG